MSLAVNDASKECYDFLKKSKGWLRRYKKCYPEFYVETSAEVEEASLLTDRGNEIEGFQDVYAYIVKRVKQVEAIIASRQAAALLTSDDFTENTVESMSADKKGSGGGGGMKVNTAAIGDMNSNDPNVEKRQQGVGNLLAKIGNIAKNEKAKPNGGMPSAGGGPAGGFGSQSGMF